MATILEDVKRANGVMPNNLGFDDELLIYINSAASELVQLGVDDFDGLLIEGSTLWPSFTTSTLRNLVKHYIPLYVKQSFDPIASETIAKAFASTREILSGRINHEAEEIAIVGTIPGDPGDAGGAGETP